MTTISDWWHSGQVERAWLQLRKLLTLQKMRRRSWKSLGEKKIWHFPHFPRSIGCWFSKKSWCPVMFLVPCRYIMDHHGTSIPVKIWFRRLTFVSFRIFSYIIFIPSFLKTIPSHELSGISFWCGSFLWRRQGCHLVKLKTLEPFESAISRPISSSHECLLNDCQSPKNDENLKFKS